MILQEAIKDLMHPDVEPRGIRKGQFAGPEGKVYEAFLDAAVWIFDPRDEKWYYSFERICARMDMNAQAIRESVLARLTPMRQGHIRNLLRRYMRGC